ncbi:MAG: ABC transporter permease [Candidatus Rokubacteria bacterium]|nr:ABC transporter permease [Candidatus Rokubacteria bacterium]
MGADAAGLTRIGALVRHEAILLARAPGPLVGYTVMPLLLMTVLRPMLELLARASPATELHGTAHAATGMAVMFSLFAVKMVGAGFLEERTWHTWDRLRASPVRGCEILIGKAVPMLVGLIVQQSIIIGFAMAAFGLRPATTWWPLAVAVVVWSGCILVLGIAGATLVRTPAQLGVAGDIAAVLTSILGGALVPTALLPSWLGYIGPASPGYWGMRCYRAAFLDPGTSSMMGSVAGLALFLAVGVVASASLVRRTD